MQRFANPNRFLRLQSAVQPWAWGIAALLLAAGLYIGLVTSPQDFRQGETVRIMYVHVPAAWMALMVYTVMALASATAFIFRHPLADVAAKAAAPIGACFCFLALVTGSLWGKPMWGAWWVWDARLTSMFVLFLLYLGYIAIWEAFDDQSKAAKLAAIVALVGFVNVPIIKFSVDWWYTLHQPASVFRLDGPTLDRSMLVPLLIMGAAYMFLFLALHMRAIRSEIEARRIHQMELARAGGV